MRDPGPLAGDDAVDDALALLCEAAPAPDEAVALDAVLDVFWTFWLRHQRPDDPDAERNVSVALSTFGFLCPRVTEDVRRQLPESLCAAFQPDDPAHEARFGCLVSAAHGVAVAAGRDQQAALERALAWADDAMRRLPDDHDGVVEVAFHTHGLHLARFQLTADPDALAAAARHAAVVCQRLRPDSPTLAAAAQATGADPATDAAAAATLALTVSLGTVIDAARMLGEPGLAEVERLAAAVPAEAMIPELADGLRMLREIEAAPVGWPGERDLRVGVILADAGGRERDAGRLACGVRRLRAALGAATAHTPVDHPARPAAAAGLGQALLALAGLAEERGDVAAAQEAHREGTELLTSADVIRAADGDDARALRALGHLTRLPEGDERALPALRQFAELLVERATRQGLPPNVDLEILLLATGDLAAAPRSEARVSRFRAAVDRLAPDHPRRFSYVAVLAALVGCLAQALRAKEPTRADQLAAEARSLTDEVAAGAPADFPPLGPLRQGFFEFALPLAISLCVAGHPGLGPAGEPDGAGAETTRLVAMLSRLADVHLDEPEHLDADITTLRALYAEYGDDDPSLRALLAALLATTLATRAAERGDQSDSDEVSELLTYAREHEPDIASDPAITAILAGALNASALAGFDAEKAREVSVLLATALAQATGEPETTELDPAEPDSAAADPGAPDLGRLTVADGVVDDGVVDDGQVDELDQAVLTTRVAFENALQNYLFSFDPAQLDRAREVAGRLTELSEEADARDTAAGRPLRYHLMGRLYADLAETVGSGGGPLADLTDDLVDRCRRSYQMSPHGNGVRVLSATTLLRVLTQRAIALRGQGDAAGADRLLTEADEVVHAVEDQAPDGWGPTMRFFVHGLGSGKLLPASPTSSALPSPESLREANPIFSRVPSLVTGTMPDDPAAWRDPGIPTWVRAHGAIGSAARATQQVGGVDRALDHLETAVDAMAALTDRGSDQASAEHGLVSFDGDIRGIVDLILTHVVLERGATQAPDVATTTRELLTDITEQRRPVDDLVADLAALNASLDAVSSFAPVTGPVVDRATELLERGRGLLLVRRIEARADLDELRSAHPALAAEFERLTDLLAADAEADAAERPAGHAERARLARLRASRELDALLERVRRQPGFEIFLRRLPADQLRALAAHGPIVVLNHARGNCLAIAVTERSIAAVRLPAEADEVSDAARRLREAIDAISAHGGARPSPAGLVAAGATVRETLAWTWHAVVRPVLDLVGLRDPVAAGGAWPRLWWIPTGAFNALPLHAAECAGSDCPHGGDRGDHSGDHSRDHSGDDCGAALDMVVSSYVPGFQTLAYARGRAAHRTAAGVPGRAPALLVAEPEDELPGVAAAAGYAAELLRAPAPLVGAAANRDTVLAALGGTPWAHFGCHAITDRAEPSGAWLRLPSGEPLSVLEICRARPDSARLAFLAACGTARTAERLSDEAIHITSAFLLAGFPTAVGTLWEIDSGHAEHVTRDFYRRMAGHGVDTSAHALHHTVRALRRRLPDRPHVWAAFVHAGT